MLRKTGSFAITCIVILRQRGLNMLRMLFAKHRHLSVVFMD